MGSAAQVRAADTSLDRSADRGHIIEVVTLIGVAADRHDWSALEACFADQVRLDYVSMAGGQPATLSPRQIIETWRPFFSDFALTRHMITNHQV